MGGGEVTCHERAVHGKALNPSMGAPTPLIDGLGKVRYLDTSGPSMARRSTHPWERRHLLSTDWGLGDIHLTTCPSPSAQTSAHTKSWRSLAGSMEFKIRCKTTSMRHRPGRDNKQ